jgi:agmatinase
MIASLGLSLLSVCTCGLSAAAREITFPPVAPVLQQYSGGGQQDPVSLGAKPDVAEFEKYSGLTTFANVPWVHCLSEGPVDGYDIAFLGAPFDTATTARPGARFGPTGIRWY